MSTARVVFLSRTSPDTTTGWPSSSRARRRVSSRILSRNNNHHRRVTSLGAATVERDDDDRHHGDMSRVHASASGRWSPSADVVRVTDDDFDESASTLDWSRVDFERDFGPLWWSARRKKTIGEIIRREIQRGIDDARRGGGGNDVPGKCWERLSPTFAAETLMTSGLYCADVRAGLRYRARQVGESWEEFARAEDRAAERVRWASEEANRGDGGTGGEDAASKKNAWSWTRAAKVGAASAVGGAALFLTGGVAAPAVLASLNSLGAVGAATGGILATLGGVGAVFGATGAGLTGYKMMRRTSMEMEEFSFIPLRGNGRRFALHVFVPGFLREDDDLLRAWGSEKSQYVVAVADPGPLGISLERNDDGELIVVTSDADKTVVRSNAAAAGVISGSALVSYRSLDPRALLRSRSSIVLSEGASVPTVEDLEALPRPLELRLQLATAAPRHEGLNAKIDSMVREMRQVVVEKTLDSTADEDEDASPVTSKTSSSTTPAKTWGNTTGEQYVLNWEPSTLRTLGATIQFVAGKYAVRMAAPSILAKTALSSIASAVAWPVTLITVADYLDNPWTMARAKATIAGEEIANALLTRQHGRRPVTFVAYSVGAYVVESALKKLYEAGDKGKNIVERVVFISAPLSTSEETWTPMREVVSGRIVNVHSPEDWILMFFYRLKSVDTTLGLAGLQPVGHNDVENYEMPLKHARIPDKISEILAHVDLKE